MTEFDKIVEFNEQLVLVAKTGLPIDIRNDDDRQSIEQAISQLGARVGVRVAKGDSVQVAIEQDALISLRYRQALLSLLRTGDTAVALEVASGKAQSERRLKSNVSQWLFQTAIVVVLTLAAFIFTISYTNPKIKSVYEDLSLEQGATFSWLEIVRDWLPAWLPMLVLLFVVGAFLWKRYGERLHWSSIPGGTGYANAVKSSQTAEQMAGLLEQGIPMSESMSICGIGASTDAGGTLSLRDGNQLSPLLRWAVTVNIDEHERGDVLRFVAGSYRNKAERLATVWRYLVPSIATALIGGVIVLIYALSIFVPWIHFLEAFT
ncbi:hypothetical protein SH528x_003968 [Novipirellula sp. SH528]|uniref:hypothetical protein n=1 Tax=Novipirellula sp. SH528 TaxID=3454466 RepID=UPI003F9F2870